MTVMNQFFLGNTYCGTSVVWLLNKHIQIKTYNCKHTKNDKYNDNYKYKVKTDVILKE